MSKENENLNKAENSEFNISDVISCFISEKQKKEEEDYIAWDSLINDPMITGSRGDDGCVLPIVLLIIAVGFTVYYLF